MCTKALFILLVGLAALTMCGCGEGGVDAQDDTAASCDGSPVTVNVLSNDKVGGGVNVDSVSIKKAPLASLGTAVVNADKTITFTPVAGASGQAKIEYDVGFHSKRQKIRHSQAELKVSVHSVDQPPTANGDTVSTPIDSSLKIDVLKNDTDADSSAASGDKLTITKVTVPASGTAEIVDGGQRILYTPTGTVTTADTFQYTISDQCGSTSTATVTVNVQGPPPPPPAHVLLVNDSNFAITVFVGDVEINKVQPNGMTIVPVDVAVGENQQVRVEALLPAPDAPRETKNLCKFDSEVAYTLTYTDNDIDPASIGIEITK